MKPELRIKVAYDIMALVDEYPSEPFTYERKMILEKLEDLFARFVQQSDNELDYSFHLGFEEGENSMRDELNFEIEDLRNEISNLEYQLEQTKKDGYDDGFTEGYETARAEFNGT